ncbi:MAG: hypothetical protein U0930_23410 [Pirellulales bacterium]
MSERRSLVEGIKTSTQKVDPTLEKAFVFGTEAPTPEIKETASRNVSRSPLSTRVRVDLAMALKRVSLERQLAGSYPNSLQDILEEALESWLMVNGHANTVN